MFARLFATVLGLCFFIPVHAGDLSESAVLRELGIQNPQTTLEQLASLPQCWVCQVSDGKRHFSRSGDTQAEARANSLSACEKLSKTPKHCQMGHCWTAQLTTCNGQTAAPPPTTTPEPTPNPDGHCTSNFDCYTGFQVCLNGQCVEKGGLDNRCHSDMDCGFPNKCLNGRCGESGIDGCNSNIDCPGQQCVSGQCTPNPIVRICTVDSQCPILQHCLLGRCEP